MAYDALGILQASVTKTADFDSTGIDLVTGTPEVGLVARVIVTAASGTDETADFAIEHSDDNSSYSVCASFPQFTATGEKFLRFFTKKRYVRLAATIGGTTPSFTYQGALTLSQP